MKTNFNQKNKFYSYTAQTNNLSTRIDKKSMQQVYKKLNNPPKGTVSLNRILDEISCEQQS